MARAVQINQKTVKGTLLYTWLPDGQILAGKFAWIDQHDFVHFQREEGQPLLLPQHREFCHRLPKSAVLQALNSLQKHQEQTATTITRLRNALINKTCRALVQMQPECNILTPRETVIAKERR